MKLFLISFKFKFPVRFKDLFRLDDNIKGQFCPHLATLT